MVHTQFLSDFKELQQKGRTISIHNQEKVEQEIRSLINQGRIVKLESCSDKQFDGPIFINQTAQEDNKKPGTTFFSTIDLRYAYSQLKLDDTTRTQCILSIIGGQATGTYQFQTVFYGLTDMPAELQKAIDRTINNPKDTFAFLDDILIISHRTTDHHMEKIKRVLDRLE